MLLNLRDLRQARLPVSRIEDIDLPRIVEENRQVVAVAPIRCDLTAESSNHEIRVYGTLSTEVTYQCSRCLEPFVTDLLASFEELFTDEAAKADEDHHFVAGDVVELNPFVEQSINLELEYIPVCSENCQGLCTVCGSNRNLEPCSCDTERVDPRLAALRDLLSEDKSE